MAALIHKSPFLRLAIGSLWHSLKRDIFDNYRPELHYMRGPGPKWHAKNKGLIETSRVG
jgi:hypothetical protein